MGFEWLYRFAQEPRRLWRRYLIGIPVFMFGVLTDLGRRRPEPEFSAHSQPFSVRQPLPVDPPGQRPVTDTVYRTTTRPSDAGG
jgi:hypothetical protein